MKRINIPMAEVALCISTCPVLTNLNAYVTGDGDREPYILSIYQEDLKETLFANALSFLEGVPANERSFNENWVRLDLTPTGVAILNEYVVKVATIFNQYLIGHYGPGDMMEIGEANDVIWVIDIYKKGEPQVEPNSNLLDELEAQFGHLSDAIERGKQ